MYTHQVDPYGPYITVPSVNAEAAFNLLEESGMDVLESQHTKMTPYRLAHYLRYWYRPKDDIRFTVFDNKDPVIDQMIVVDPIPFWACCSHHMLPFFGDVYFGYIPESKLIGLSQIPMLVQSFCTRSWLQEVMTKELADHIESLVLPLGLGIIVKAIHTCEMMDLGPTISFMTSSEMRGNFHDEDVKQEFMGLVL